MASMFQHYTYILVPITLLATCQWYYLYNDYYIYYYWQEEYI
jgi:hypothetical protein